MMRRGLLIGAAFFVALGCNPDKEIPGDTTVVRDTMDSKGADSDAGDQACPGDFPSGEGPGCCLEQDVWPPDAGRATCDEGEWTCSTGALCLCNDEPMLFECFDDCDWAEASLPGCVFSDHWECFE